MQDVFTAAEVLRRSTSAAGLNMMLLASFAACGLFLAVVGVYGVMSLYVGQRQRELGIRIALGASRGDVGRLVVRQSAVVLLSGIVIGTLGAAWLATYLPSLLYETPPRDAGSFAAASVAIAAGARRRHDRADHPRAAGRSDDAAAGRLTGPRRRLPQDC